MRGEYVRRDCPCSGMEMPPGLWPDRCPLCGREIRSLSQMEADRRWMSERHALRADHERDESGPTPAEALRALLGEEGGQHDAG
jgi:hypothetical protein